MSERMSASDVAFLRRETRTVPQHVGGLAVFAPPSSGFDYDRLVRLLEERISLAPRYRQKVRAVPGHLANPVWVDDPRFDITYHVRRSALPRPGRDEQLLEFCARIQSRLLDRGRPLWEMYLVEGLSEGRVAVITKTHEALVDERDGIDLAQVILDASPQPRRTVRPIWMPGPEPGALALVRDAAGEIVRRPLVLTDTVRGAARDLHATVARLGSIAGGMASLGGALLRTAPASALQAGPSEQRRIAIARTQLSDYRRVRAQLGGAVNDVVLAVVSGALRSWLLSRAEPLRPASSVRALVPVSVGDPDSGGSAEASGAGRVHPLLVDLPVGEPDPVVRLAQLRYAMASHLASQKAAGRVVGADTLAALAGFAPPTLHALGARAAHGLTRRMFSLVVTNVPGPQWPLYAAGARLTEMFPILPLGSGQALSIGLTSYDGGVYFGINGDRDAVHDIQLLADLIEEALAELCRAVDGHPTARGRPRSRMKPGGARPKEPR